MKHGVNLTWHFSDRCQEMHGGNRIVKTNLGEKYFKCLR